MKLVLLAVVVAFVCYMSILDPVADAQDASSTVAPPPKNKTKCRSGFKGKGKGKRSIGGTVSGSVGPGKASVSITGGGGGGVGEVIANAAVNGAKNAASAAAAGGKLIRAAITDGMKQAKGPTPKRQPPKSASAKFTVNN